VSSALAHGRPAFTRARYKSRASAWQAIRLAAFLPSRLAHGRSFVSLFARTSFVRGRPIRSRRDASESLSVVPVAQDVHDNGSSVDDEPDSEVSASILARRGRLPLRLLLARTFRFRTEASCSATLAAAFPEQTR